MAATLKVASCMLAVLAGAVHVRGKTDTRVEDTRVFEVIEGKLGLWFAFFGTTTATYAKVVECREGGFAENHHLLGWTLAAFWNSAGKRVVFDPTQDAHMDFVRVQRPLRVEFVKDSFVENVKFAVRPPAPRVDLTPFESVGPDQWLDGTVVSIKGFGAFVQVAPPGSEEPAQGLVHITQISDDYVENIGDVVSVGDDVKVRVVSVDTEIGKLSLSMKSEGGVGRRGGSR